ncbi:carotenoid biosynthesis protein [Halocalculus aciditolerans]|uniref:Carotenoid biosynthesis protein n=1 Tax=Halocalculus aciditolerans TaxID=1383812 RepID=A0A830F3Y7_9EURY|nr:carotenoid biosynthesis protein [Halocalculus aciditolerans]GGL61101.1 hypothetical protein GCM10009039_19080 [Halocalculus aciditolerans]
MARSHRSHPSHRSLITALFAALVAVHAGLSWPPALVVAFFSGGMALAFLAEAVGVALGLVRHHTRPRVAGVPLHVVAAWPAVGYLAYRFARVFVPADARAVLVAALVATAVDAFLDPLGVDAEAWSYPDHPLSGLRFRGVPWWNAVAWFVLVALTASIPLLWR